MEKNTSHRLSSPKSYAVAAERFQNVAKIGFSPEIHPHGIRWQMKKSVQQHKASQFFRPMEKAAKAKHGPKVKA